MRANLWNKSVPRVELDQRARDARLGLERLERLLMPRTAATVYWIGRDLAGANPVDLRGRVPHG